MNQPHIFFDKIKSSEIHQIFINFTIILLSAIFILFWIYVIRTYQVNVPFLDQFDIYYLFYQKNENLLSLFFAQHSWHRLGIFAMFNYISAKLFHLDIRIDSYLYLFFNTFSYVLSLIVSKKLFKKFSLVDLSLLFIFFNLSQYSSLIITVILSHAPGPLFLLFALIYTLSHKYSVNRELLLLFISFLLIFSGPGLAVIPAMISYLVYYSFLKKSDLHKLYIFPVFILGIFIFFNKYIFIESTNLFDIVKNLLKIIRFLSFNYSGYFVDTKNIFGLTFGILLFVINLLILIHSMKMSFIKDIKIYLPVFFLSSFTLSINLLTSFGRYSLLPDVSGESRYMQSQIPFLVSMIYFFKIHFKKIKLNTYFSFIIFLLVMISAILSFSRAREHLLFQKNNKIGWLECYKQNENIPKCNKNWYPIYPINNDQENFYKVLKIMKNEKTGIFYK